MVSVGHSLDRLTRDNLERLLHGEFSGALSGSIAILDIDAVIMDVSPRNLRILLEAAKAIPTIRPAVEHIRPDEISGNLNEALERYMYLPDSTRGQVSAFWWERFFSDAYVLWDQPYPGIREVLQWLRAESVSLVYLTGRDAPNMATGTIESFRRHGLPVGEGTRFLFKPVFSQPDLTFKRDALNGIGSVRPVSVALVHESEIASMIRETFPGALVALVDPEPGSTLTDSMMPGIEIFSHRRSAT